MKKTKKIIVTVVFILAITFLASGVYLLVSKPDNKKITKDNNKFYSMPEEKRLSIKNCKTSICHTTETDYYDTLVVNDEYKALNEKVKKINKETKALYKMANESTTNTAQCASVKDMYYHEYRVNSVYFNYENDKYASVAVQRNIINLCANTYERKQLEWYLYDKGNKKLLTQEQFKEKEEITESAITLVINNTIQQINKDESTNIQPKVQYTDTVVFYDYQGNILVSFYIEELNTYTDAIVKVNVEKES